MAVPVSGCSGGSGDSSAGSTARPISAVPSSIDNVNDVCTSPPDQHCYSVDAFRAAYGISPLLTRGIDGRGETVVLVEWLASTAPPQTAAPTNIFQDVSAFDRYFHLPTVDLTVVRGSAPKAAADLAIGEEVEDVEMVHAVAPGAAIRVVLAGPRAYSAGATLADLKAAAAASKGADIVSISGGAWEDCFTDNQLTQAHSLIGQLASRHVTVTASSGDSGAANVRCSAPFGPVPTRGVQYPASDPQVLAVGGTTLVADPTTGSYTSERAWNSPKYGSSGGGFSRDFARPSYQDGVAGIAAHRGVPDVAGDAGDSTGLALINVFPSGPVMETAAGTSAGAPFWAGLIALADQYADRDLGPVNTAVYRIAHSADYPAAFHDVVTGDNTVIVAGKALKGYHAKPGWSPVTGWGTPIASVLVPLLVRDDQS